MTNSIPLGTIIRIFLAMASMAASLNSYAAPGTEPASTPAVTPAAKYQAVAAALLKGGVSSNRRKFRLITWPR